MEARMSAAQKVQSVLVKQYARSRLYDTTNQRYVSVEQLRSWTAEGLAFAVIDAETGEDITGVLLGKPRV
jgi:polyhydroxyalkanoate synthesis regulator protein